MFNFIRFFDYKTKSYSNLVAHNDIVLALDFIDNYLLTSSKDKLIKLWNYFDKNFILLATFCGHLESVGTVALAPKSLDFFISGSADKSIKVWSITTLMKLLKKNQKSGNNEPIQVTSAIRSIYAHEKDINVVKFSPNEKWFASASQDRTIKVKNLFLLLQ